MPALVSEVEEPMKARFSWIGVKLGGLGFTIAMVGAVFAFKIDHEIGHTLAAVGITLGFIGVGLHLAEMFLKRRHQGPKDDCCQATSWSMVHR